MTTATASSRDDIAALMLGLALLCAGALALIGGSGVTLWIAGIH